MRRLAGRPLHATGATLGLLLALSGCSFLKFGTPAEQGQKFVIFFQPFSAGLDTAAQGSIKAAAASAKYHFQAPVTVAGFASPIGTTQANADLARSRAQIVSEGLMADGVDPSRIKRRALGEVDYTLDPLESRRVEISVGP